MAFSEVDATAGRASPGTLHHRSRPSSPVSSTSLNHVHIAEALLKSEDGGATLDLSHKNLTDVGEYGAHELAVIGREDNLEDDSTVLRITLANNRLATLPMAFAVLSRLRYLNLKCNSFTVFPEVLTIMPSLEILDIGRNKIKRLPSQPGSLANLRVFSLYKNKLTRLPAYMVQFTRLHILRVEQNPLEWPPKSVMEAGSTESNASSRNWIMGLQQWMAENGTSSEYRKLSDDSILINDPARGSAPRDDSLDYDIRSPDYDHGQTPHARSFSAMSDLSVYSADKPETSVGPFALSPRLERPPPLHLGSLPLSAPNGSSVSPSRSPDSYLPTPEESVSSMDDETFKYSVEAQSHARNASYAGSNRNVSLSRLTGKKSLPELRPARLRLDSGAVNAGLPSVPLGGQANFRAISKANKSMDQFSMPSPISQRQDSSESDTFSIPSHTARPFAQGPVSASPTSLDHPVPSMDVERNSYFRRFSTIPSSTISKTIPTSLLSLVDAVRGILFAVSQVYQTLQHYTVYAIDERLSSVLLKVLDPASNYMTQLINALDRFDSMSRRMLPTPAVCRAVIESCKDNVTVFGKAVGVLALQLKVLATRDDVRYTRQMLLVLYGATAEISNAWQSMTPHIDAVEPLLRDHRPPPVGKPRPSQSSTHTTLVNALDTSISIPPIAPVLAPPHTPRSPAHSPVGRTHIARRHAGSFSSKDVEIGRSLPSHVELPSLQGGLAARTAVDIATPRAALRQAGFFVPITTTVPTPNKPSSKSSKQAWDSHSRQGSQTSLQGSSSGSSPSISGRTPMFEPPADLSTLVDKPAIEAMSKAVEAAPPVWDMLDAMLADLPENREEIEESLGKAQAVTRNLKEGISNIQSDVQVDRKDLRDHARLFVKVYCSLLSYFLCLYSSILAKTVVQLSTTIKTYGSSHPLSSVLRSNMVTLTNATEEFVILLHVSSFSSPTTPRPYSPMVNVAMPTNNNALGTDEGRLGASLSRSRSAQAVATKPKSPIPTRELPHSALPNQTFKISTPPRRMRRELLLAADDALDGY
ncbi:hypothetical protein EW146_g710 [Bondarzewia mesenterica]|uniref:RAM signaling network component n=1 Tax=Bondarzewia mesenterica TaxID=1095465 RepID=A0A4S4M7Z1_9AGAM|nr:hypothetical protein EW146_g710 [Bondarzewia mesenterica]